MIYDEANNPLQPNAPDQRSIQFPGALKSALAGSLLLLMTGSCKKMDMDLYRGVSYDAIYVVNGESSSLSIIDLSSLNVRKTISLGESGGAGHGSMPMKLSWPHHFSLHPDNQQLAIGAPGMDLSAGHGGQMEGMPGQIGLVEAVTGTVKQIIELPASNHNAIFSPDGNEIWTSQMQADGQVRVYDARTLVLKHTLSVGKDPAEVTFSADGRMAFVANGMDNTVTAIDPLTKEIKATIAVGEDPVGAWPGEDNRMYVDNEHGKSISIIHAGTLQVEETIDLGFTPAYATYRGGTSPELWISDPDGGRVHYFQRQGSSWVNAGSLVTGAGAHAIAVDRDGQRGYVTNQLAGTVSVLDLAGKQKLKDVAVGKKPNGILIRYQK